MMQEKKIHRYVEGWQRGARARRTDWFGEPELALQSAREKKFFCPKMESSTIQVPMPVSASAPEVIGTVFGFPVTSEMLENNCYHCGSSLAEDDDPILLTCRNCWEV